MPGTRFYGNPDCPDTRNSHPFFADEECDDSRLRPSPEERLEELEVGLKDMRRHVDEMRERIEQLEKVQKLH